MGTIIQNGNVGAIIQNGIVYGGAIPIDKSSSKLSTYKNIYNNNSLVFFDNDDRFSVTFSGDNTNPWTIQNLFTYEGQNMYSAPTITHGQTTSANITNISDKTIFLRVIYKSETEGHSYDYGTISYDGTVIVTEIGGTVSGATEFIAISQGATLTLTYRKDSGGTVGVDNVGMLLYELEVV